MGPLVGPLLNKYIQIYQTNMANLVHETKYGLSFFLYRKFESLTLSVFCNTLNVMFGDFWKLAILKSLLKKRQGRIFSTTFIFPYWYPFAINREQKEQYNSIKNYLEQMAPLHPQPKKIISWHFYLKTERCIISEHPGIIPRTTNLSKKFLIKLRQCIFTAPKKCTLYSICGQQQKPVYHE